MKPFLHDDFLLETDAARRLYHDYAKGMPILDYHSHLPPDQVADDKRFADLASLWLGGDHYKWRLMRSAGVTEDYITGSQPGREKFLAWAATVPKALGNPVYHWAHLELQRYFGIAEPLNPATAPRIWDAANERLQDKSFSVKGLLKQMDVVALCTTDDPADNLEHHKRHRGAPVMAPTFRPDKALAAQLPTWKGYLTTLGAAAGVEIASRKTLVEALDKRHQAFHDAGCRLTDHALVVPPCAEATPAELDATFAALFAGRAVAPEDLEALQADLLATIGRLNTERGWTMQLHIGAQRNLNATMFAKLGPDTGYDAISDLPIAIPTAKLLDRLAREGALPRTILYTLNPVAFEALGSVMGAFQEGPVAGKVQLGSAWWFDDHIDGMTRQLEALGNLGVLSTFVGMLTDSRSFLSFPRHEYFRRILCGLLGGWMDRGLVPGDFDLVGGVVKDIAFRNVRAFLGIPGVPERA